MSEFWLYVKLGFNHVLDWTAYDHILFLVVLVIGYTFDHWKRILLLVTLFTLGHTVSLFLAAYNVVSVNASLVEFLIPITILATAIFNILTSKNGSNTSKIGVLYGTTIFFGLIHGLGFSNYFKAISSNVSSKILPLIEFALGVEAAQLVVVLFVLIVSFIFQSFLRFSKREWILVVSSIVIGMVIPMIIANKIW
ncbi:HupE/UreJ family protein [Aquimarina sp. D1M17]|uniref:HupE/UreJ family protein n=1 Tax=Aquimarina acroporae TaxID=2937283 RepID=UPI0020BF963C|nr:HupE/UreJ family protein [Aquimarina acroporae]MCK8522624.1 HupE/UreJ family protein [Aquimarina acroporae]